MLLTHRQLLLSKAIAIENDLRGTLRNFGLKVGNNPRSSTCRVELHWRPGPGADHGRMARIAEAWDIQQRRARRGVQTQAQAYVFNVFGWLAEAARS